MNTWITLLRGINVGGRNKLPMKTLVELVEEIGGRDVQTYIQSGNAVFRHDEADPTRLADALTEAVSATCGFRPRTMLLEPDELGGALADNPFPEATAEPSKLHFGFLEGQPEEPDRGRLDSLRSGSERYALVGRVFYLHAPDGIGRSKLAAGFEKALGIAATVRNYRTVSKLTDLAKALQSDD